MKHTVASAIIGAQQNWSRKNADFYPTPAEVTVSVVKWLMAMGFLRPGDYVREPACGDGAMAAVLEQFGLVVDATDLRMSGYGTGGVDFLTSPIGNGADWVITNPPFKLSVEFILKALKVAPNVAMLLKSQYWHAANRLGLFEQNKPEWVLPLTWRPSFLKEERGNSPLMDVIWVIWRGENEEWPRYRPLVKPVNVIEPPTVIESYFRRELA